MDLPAFSYVYSHSITAERFKLFSFICGGSSNFSGLVELKNGINPY